METMYSVEQIAGILHMHQKTIRKYICEGKLRASKLGRNWRVSGHDLSVFIESRKINPAADTKAGQGGNDNEQNPSGKITVSAVIDIPVSDIDEYSRISNMILAAMNSKHSGNFDCTLNVLHIPAEQKLRVMLWGTPKFVEIFIGCISILSENRRYVDETTNL